MASITQAQAINAINHVIAGIRNFGTLNNEFIPVVLDWGNNGIDGIVNALPTMVFNADGTPGAADGSPQSGHPIDIRLIPTLLAPGMTPFQIGVAFNIVQAILALAAGQAVSTEALAPAILGAARA